MARLRGEELWVSSCISNVLFNVEVRQHDDQSRDSMYDLDLIYPDGSKAAVEVTSAVDGESVALWKLMNGGGRWQEPSLVGGWSVSLAPSARAKLIKSRLPILLADFELRGLTRFESSTFPADPRDAFARSLGVASAWQGPTDYPGSVYLTVELPSERSGGMVADTGDALATWLSEWTHESHQDDNRRKLASSGATERHLFILVSGFTTAPFSVTDLLMRDHAPLPTIDPELPDEITDVWVMSTWNSGDGFRWSPRTGWTRFPKEATTAEDATTAKAAPD